MKVLKILGEFFLIFIIVLAVSAIVSFVYSLIVHGAGAVDYGLSVRLGISLGIVLTWLDRRRK